MTTPNPATTGEALEAAAFPHLSQTCWCGKCDSEAADALPTGDFLRLMRRMNLCPDCGNKRCPRAWWHDYACGGSNAPHQAPSSASGVPVSVQRQEKQP